MKTKTAVLIVSCLSLAFAAWTIAAAVGAATELRGIPWSQVAADHAITPDNARVRDASGKLLVSQSVDNDGDGKVDELLYLGTGDGKVTIFAGTEPVPALENRVVARYAPERSDDFAWENELVGFRAYGPALRKGIENAGIDVMTKRVPYPALEKWFRDEKVGKTYHIDTGTGYDNYKVNASLGCGGSAVWGSDGRLYLGETYTTWKQYAAGPLRAVWELNYGPWTVDGKNITEKKLFSFDLGDRMFKVTDTFYIDGQPAKGLPVAVGVATHEGKAEAFGDQEKGILVVTEKQDGAWLGLGVYAPPSQIVEYRNIKSNDRDQNNAVFILKTDDNGQVVYYAGYAWEKWGGITTVEQWKDYLSKFADQHGM